MNKHILVTGANGQLGSEIRQMVKDSTDYYLFTDITELDITDTIAISNIIDSKNIDIIINCAAYTNVDKAEQEAELANLLNNIAVSNLAKVAAEKNLLLIHISTDYIFDGKGYIPYTEGCKPSPLNTYGNTKLAGEQGVIDSGCKYIIIRTSWLYSQWGSNFVKTMLNLTAERDSLGVIFDQIGTPTYAGDLANAIIGIINSEKLEKVGIYHFSNEGVCSWYDFAQEINSINGNYCQIKAIHSTDYPSKALRPHYSVLDKSKFKETFAVEIPYWKESLARCINKINRAE